MGWKKLQGKNLRRLIYQPVKVDRASRNFFNASSVLPPRLSPAGTSEISQPQRGWESARKFIRPGGTTEMNSTVPSGRILF
jgi:hypothetical protein